MRATICSLALLLITISAEAYRVAVLPQNPATATLQRHPVPHSEFIRIYYSHIDSPFADRAAVESVLQAAIDDWRATPDTKWSLAHLSPGDSIVDPYIEMVRWYAEPESTTVAYTTLWMSATGGTSNSGRIHLNAARPFSLRGVPPDGAHDLGTVLRHEIGHLAGGAHTDHSDAVMYGVRATGAASVVALTDDDRWILRYLYRTISASGSDIPLTIEEDKDVIVRLSVHISRHTSEPLPANVMFRVDVSCETPGVLFEPAESQGPWANIVRHPAGSTIERYDGSTMTALHPVITATKHGVRSASWDSLSIRIRAPRGSGPVVLTYRASSLDTTLQENPITVYEGNVHQWPTGAFGSLDPRDVFSWTAMDQQGFPAWRQSIDVAACHTVTTSVAPPGTGVIDPLSAQNCTRGYLAGTQLSVITRSPEGYIFAGWTGSGGRFSSTSSPSTTFTVDADSVITAQYAERGCWSFVVHQSRGGTITGDTLPNCPNLGYIGGTDIKLMATPARGYDLDGWNGEGGQFNSPFGHSMTFKISGDARVSASFRPKPCVVTEAVASPLHGGTVAATAKDCSSGYWPGTTVGLTATAAAGFRFARWWFPDDVTFTSNGTSASFVMPARTDIRVYALFASTHPRVRGDVDGDGKADLLWRHGGNGATYLWKFDGTNVTASALPTVADQGWKIFGYDDFDKDSRAEIAWRRLDSPVRGYLWNVDASGATGEAMTDLRDFTDGIGVADVNGDGDADVVGFGVRHTPNPVRVWFMHGPAAETPSYGLADATGYSGAGLGDLDGDGRADLVWRRTSSPGDNWVWLLDGPRLQVRQLPQVADMEYSIAGVADVSGDGKADLVWRRTTGEVYVWVMNGAAIAEQYAVHREPDPAWQIRAIIDIDGNGRAELLWRHATSGANYVWFLNGAAVTALPLPTVADPEWRMEGPR